MVIDNLNFQGVSIYPFKNNSPLIIDTDTVKLLCPTFKLFQSIARRYTKIAS